MLEEILIAGFGGQGVMLMGQLLAYGSINEGLNVTFFPSYGPEMRGGTANCTVVISDEKIGSPVRNAFTALMAMNQSSLDKFQARLKPGGLLAYNETLIACAPRQPHIRMVPIPASEIAQELGNPLTANMVALGALAAALDFISLHSLSAGLKKVLPESRHHLIPLNEEAIRRGMKWLHGGARS